MAIKIIGVTGPSGAGKSYLSSTLANKGFPVIDADVVYHSLLTKDSDCTHALVGEFGTEILDEQGAPNTKKLAAVVFSSEKKLEKLNHLVLDFVIIEIKKMIGELERNGNTVVIVDAPTLIESGFSKECDVVISVLSTRDTRIERIIKRDGISYDTALVRVLAQKDDDFYEKNSHIVLSNNGNTESFNSRIDGMIKSILS